MNFQDRVLSLTKKIPKGKVSTYKEIARAMKTKAYRAVGAALKNNPCAPKVPCHRVVASDGTVGGYQGKMNNKKKEIILKKEGIEIRNNRIVDFEKKLFRF